MKRRQLTLFVSDKNASEIEIIRQKYNPLQYELIKSHVTLCREDEILDFEKISLNLKNLYQKPFFINFGLVKRFSENNGVLLPSIGKNKEFHGLRRKILAGITPNPRNHEPHITLMHPRNSECTDVIFHEIEAVKFPSQILFNKISLIEQEEGEKWQVLEEFEL
ncbi:2'-5' RNA ligase family protein [Lacihabitans sp. LS3-19]|uniref:2'-5' RNA ligase family protein n=1 Tax=Lacihabitans sp. LS3-19 TaxID=2487335 RepID=UPI0020CDE338|nr:2'-5' RNA ligase family protein [Lacihabitans sp. LS3-19]MCP9769975.1 2'-5' RNA ligase family protein [Lacihabitans sp. LS3-19]